MRIFINHSRERELKRLKGVGPKLAARIIELRERRPFRDPKDIWHRVTGISERTVESWNEQEDVLVIFEEQKVSEQPSITRGLIVDSIAGLIAVILFLGFSRSDLLFPGSKMKSDPRPLNATANHTIYFECMDDRDCERGHRCFPGMLHPGDDNTSDLSEYKEEYNYWVDSKYGLQRLRSEAAGLMSMHYLESGKRCWSTASEVGADCGDHVHQICDYKKNLSCVYGKCRETNDAALVRGMSVKGRGFVSRDALFCGSLAGCLIGHLGKSYSNIDPKGALSVEAEEYWKNRMEALWNPPGAVQENTEEWENAENPLPYGAEEEIKEKKEEDEVQSQLQHFVLLFVAFVLGGIVYVPGWQCISVYQQKGSMVSLNKSSANELRGLHGVGPAMAKRIIAERSFSSWQDLRARVPGLGSKMLSDWENDHRICL